MALIDEVKARFPTQRLVDITNPESASASSIDDTLLAKAVIDAQAEFEVLTGLEYDNNEAKHVYVAMQGVLYFCHLYRGIAYEDLARHETRWREACTALGKVTSRNRITPTTNSKLQPSAEQVGDEVVRPDFDRDYTNGYVPGPPGRYPHFGRPGREIDT